MTERGKYIVIEGTEGAGKGTQCEIIANWLAGMGQRCRVVREPGGDPFGEALRLVLKDPDLHHEADEELLTFVAARMGMRRRVVLPALEAGEWVIADRSEASTFVYQGIVGGTDLDEIRLLHEKYVDPICRPDLFIVITLPYDESERRVDGRGEARDFFESQGEQYLRMIANGYMDACRIMREMGYTTHEIYGLQSIERVSLAIKTLLEENVLTS